MGTPASPELLDLLAGRPCSMELDRAALELARIEFPDLDAEASIAELDRIAWAIAGRARDLSDGECFVRTTNEYLFGVLGFRGNQEAYYAAENSCLNRVLETRLGIPITLSIVYLEIARRLAKPVTGVGLPGHFLVRYEDENVRAFIDPFHSGNILDEQGCARLVQAETLAPEFLAPVDRRYVVMRMMNNLRQIYFSQRQPAKAERLLDLMIAADPQRPEEHKQRAVVLWQQNRGVESLAGFRKYLELAPQASDRAQVEEQIRNLTIWLASRN